MLQATSPAVVSAGSGTGVGAVLTASAPTWNQTDVTTTYMWLKDGQQQWTNTGPTYTIGSDDVGKSISVLATGSKPGFPSAKSTSNAVTATQGAAPEMTTAPTLRGTGAVGQYITVDPGAWGVTLPTYSYTWLRNGTPIPNATGVTYGLTADDAATQISVRVTVASAGRANAVAVTAPLAVAQLASTTTLSVAPYGLTRNKRGKLTITVAAPGLAAPLGTLQLKDGKKKLGALKLVAKNKGVITFKLPRLKAGKHKLKVVYSGTPAVKRSTGKLKLVVAR